MGGMQMSLAVAGLLRYKVLALRLGSSGLGEYQQLVTAAGTATVVVSFGLAFALNRNIATARDAEHRQQLLATSNTIIWTITGVVYLSCFAALAFDPRLVDRIGVKATPSAIATLVILLIGIPFETLKTNLVSFLMASLDVRGVTSRRSVAVLAATVISTPVVWLFGPVGAAIQSVVVNLGLVAALGIRCKQLGYAPFRLRLDRQCATVLAAFGVAQLFAGFVQQFLDLVVRTHLITQYGASQNGFYQSSLLLAGQVQTILSGVASYALGSLGNERDRAHATASSNLLLRTVLPVATLAFAGIGILAKPLLVLLYSSSFTGAVAFFPFVLAMMFLEAVVWVIDAPLLAHRGVRIWVLVNVTYCSARAVAAIALLPVIGPTGVAIGYFAAMCLYLSMHVYVFTRVLGLTIDRTHFRNIALGLALILGTALPVSGTSPVLLRYLVAISLYLAYFVFIVHDTVGISAARNFVRRLRPEPESAT
jgi:O-antigen/teichoic acid export membrane protein